MLQFTWKHPSNFDFIAGFLTMQDDMSASDIQTFKNKNELKLYHVAETEM